MGLLRPSRDSVQHLSGRVFWKPGQGGAERTEGGMSCVPTPGDREARGMRRLCLVGREATFRNEKLRGSGRWISSSGLRPFPAWDLQAFRSRGPIRAALRGQEQREVWFQSVPGRVALPGVGLTPFQPPVPFRALSVKPGPFPRRTVRVHCAEHLLRKQVSHL